LEPDSDASHIRSGVNHFKEKKENKEKQVGFLYVQLFLDHFPIGSLPLSASLRAL